jgi:indole-3-glycerol phosphate synthase
MNILDKIIARKAQEVAEAKSIVSVATLEKFAFFDRKCISVKKNLTQRTLPGIIAEHKRKSPSKGIINDQLSVEFITSGYASSGVSCLSILTDSDFFGGNSQDLILAREANPQTAILRKDFIIDEYQILEAKAWGADVILLIAAHLLPQRLMELAKFAKNLDLEVLMEIHDEAELNANMNAPVDLIGVNNRNLKTFEVSIQTSLSLSEKIPNELIKIAESGINHVDEVLTLFKAGFKGFLIGESFMKTDNPGAACQELANEIKLKF